MGLTDGLLKHLRDSYFYQFYFSRIWRVDYPSISAILDRWAHEKDDFQFIQIGANDGYNNDPVNKYVRMYDGNGVLVEPQKKVFENGLKETYKGYDDLTLINAAIDSKTGTRNLYKIGFSDSKWATGLSSFDKEVVKKQYERGYVKESALEAGEKMPDDRSNYITTEKIRTITFEDLIDRCDIKEVNGLFVDAEGYDYA